MRASRILTMAAVALALASTSCSPSALTVKATKELNESSARELIEDRLSKETYKIPVDNITRLLPRTLTDYKTVNAAAGPVADLKRLLDKGLVLQTADSVSYPKISGTFVYRMEDRTQEWHLEMLANSNVVTGQCIDRYRDGTVHPAASASGRGIVQQDGKIELMTPDGRYKITSGTYLEEGPTAYLELQSTWTGTPPLVRWYGRATGKRVDVRWYTYSWSPDFQKQLVYNQNHAYVIGGYFEVGDVSGLRLVTDTEASAMLGWRVSLNDLGKLLFPTERPSGASQVTFGKKPDGTWFVDHLGISD